MVVRYMRVSDRACATMIPEIGEHSKFNEGKCRLAVGNNFGNNILKQY